MTLNIVLQIGITVLGFGAVVTNIFKKRICWILWSMSNVGWVWLYLRTGLKESIPIMIAYTLANIWGWLQWSKDLKEVKK